jgi:hypothetical protein
MRSDLDRGSPVRLLETLRTHAECEAEVLESYRRLVDECPDEGVRYLGRLIIEDEQRHHNVIAEMCNRIDSWIIQGITIEPSTPDISPRVDRVLLQETQRLIALERRDARELRALKRQLRNTSPTSLLPLLVKLMLHDTATHIEILQFIHAYAG